MSAINQAKITETNLTVAKLRAYLDQLEASWTEDDRTYLGEFENQKINIPYFKPGTPCQGLGPAAITYNGGLDFIIDMPKPQEGEVNAT
ncbi:hypothetical protein [Vreelandella venusta]|uniref:hypothetical protein n=1 Tax=Vreelandella venusta TaxID=44935 RepID=UPI001167DBF7|nr:hypothetical protein [Halomonas venusta]GEK52370.1 hypothetical protein HVE01_30910 [Halomonas venusta]